jgi:hypothetical protein
MANLYNQNIGLNYQGMLNLGGTINTPLDVSTLQYITDGMGNNTPILVSLSQVIIYSQSGSLPFAVKASSLSTGGIDIWGATNGAGEYEFIRFRDFAGNLLSQIYQYNNLLTLKSGAVEIMKLSSTQVTISGGLIYTTLTSNPTVAAGAVTFNCALADIFATTLVTGTPTAITMSNARAGSYVVRLQQPAGGSATVTWATTIVWAGGTAPTLTTTANYSDIITLIYDGTTWRGTATLNFAS